jgi:hypothetical protein
LVNGARHNEKGKCPLCKKNVIFKSIGKSKKVSDRASVQTIQKTGKNGLVIRVFKACKDYMEYFREPQFKFYENARIFIDWEDGKEIDYTFSPYYFAYNGFILTRWKKGLRPNPSKYYYNFEADVGGFLYASNLDASLKGTPWQYSGLKEYPA